MDERNKKGLGDADQSSGPGYPLQSSAEDGERISASIPIAELRDGDWTHITDEVRRVINSIGLHVCSGPRCIDMVYTNGNVYGGGREGTAFRNELSESEWLRRAKNTARRQRQERSARDRDGSGGDEGAGPKDGTHAQPGPKASPKSHS